MTIADNMLMFGLALVIGVGAIAVLLFLMAFLCSLGSKE
jgi:hypothetical protein